MPRAFFPVARILSATPAMDAVRLPDHHFLTGEGREFEVVSESVRGPFPDRIASIADRESDSDGVSAVCLWVLPRQISVSPSLLKMPFHPAVMLGFRHQLQPVFNQLAQRRQFSGRVLTVDKLQPDEIENANHPSSRGLVGALVNSSSVL